MAGRQFCARAFPFSRLPCMLLARLLFSFTAPASPLTIVTVELVCCSFVMAVILQTEANMQDMQMLLPSLYLALLYYIVNHHLCMRLRDSADTFLSPWKHAPPCDAHDQLLLICKHTYMLRNHSLVALQLMMSWCTQAALACQTVCWQWEEHRAQIGGARLLCADKKQNTNLQLQHGSCPVWLSSAVASLLPAQLSVWLLSGLPACDAAAQLAWLLSAVLPSQLSFQRSELPFSPCPQTPSLGSAGWQH